MVTEGEPLQQNKEELIKAAYVPNARTNCVVRRGGCWWCVCGGRNRRGAVGRVLCQCVCVCVCGGGGGVSGGEKSGSSAVNHVEGAAIEARDIQTQAGREDINHRQPGRQKERDGGEERGGRGGDGEVSWQRVCLLTD